MAILKMKRIRVIGETKDRSAMLAALMRFGCVELSELAPPEDAEGIVGDKSSAEKLQRLQENFNAARLLLERYAKAEKAPLFKILRKVQESDLFSTEFLEEAAKKASRIVLLGDEIEETTGEINRLNMKRASLLPWKDADVPLDSRSGINYSVMFGACPSAANVDVLKQRLSQEAPECSVSVVSSDQEQHYLFIICHKSAAEAAGLVLRDYAFSRLDLKGLEGTAQSNIKQVEAQISAAEKKRDTAAAGVEALKSARDTIEQAIDTVAILREREDMRDRLLVTRRAFYAEGWLPEERCEEVSAFLEQNGFAFEMEDPTEEDQVPICYKNNRFIQPYETLVNLYGVPQYEGGRGLDPTSAMAPFFAIFFGMMLSDAAYGVIVLILSLYVLLKVKPPKGSFLQQAFSIGVACGISTIFWGALFGGWFGNAVKTIATVFFQSDLNLGPIWFDPLEEPMTLLIMGFVLGLIHIFVGMGFSAWRSIKEKKYLDAFFDIGLWYILLISLILTIFIPQAIYVAAVGAAGIMLTGGRSARGIVGKLTGGFNSLYGISGYLSDVLSYSRLLALGLATGVVATVINTMGTLGGNGILGTIVFILVFIGGHLFNLAINVLGAYVHSSRLQYVEFFNKFFLGGGKAFLPMRYKAKYVEIIKEEM